MKQIQKRFSIATRGQGLYEVTPEFSRWLTACGASMGLLTLFCRHTSASLTIQENADSDVQSDLLQFFKSLVPENSALYRHTMEGVDDMPAHIKGALTDVSLSIPVDGGRMVLGTWQGIYLFEHRVQSHNREIIAHFIGEMDHD
ncbi:MAG: YjbQ family protein [Magnetococcales bacterium]|nr:YjbQ family protein [Magnetococcales bacterium]